VDREFVRQRIRDEEREMAAALGIRTSQRTERRQRRDFYIISRCITANMVWAAGYASAYLAYPVDPPMIHTTCTDAPSRSHGISSMVYEICVP
jgi:hypothetical protein